MKRVTTILLILCLSLTGCTALQAIVSGARTIPVADPARGEVIFREGVNGSPPCITCHALAPGGFALAPPIPGIAVRAAQRVAGLSAAAYLTQSVRDPDAYLVPGYRNLMYPGYADHFTDQDMRDLIAFMLAQ